jgi:hypothetical protein
VQGLGERQGLLQGLRGLSGPIQLAQGHRHAGEALQGDVGTAHLARQRERALLELERLVGPAVDAMEQSETVETRDLGVLALCHFEQPLRLEKRRPRPREVRAVAQHVSPRLEEASSQVSVPRLLGERQPALQPGVDLLVGQQQDDVGDRVGRVLDGAGGLELGQGALPVGACLLPILIPRDGSHSVQDAARLRPVRCGLRDGQRLVETGPRGRVVALRRAGSRDPAQGLALLDRLPLVARAHERLIEQRPCRGGGSVPLRLPGLLELLRERRLLRRDSRRRAQRQHQGDSGRARQRCAPVSTRSSRSRRRRASPA